MPGPPCHGRMCGLVAVTSVEDVGKFGLIFVPVGLAGVPVSLA